MITGRHRAAPARLAAAVLVLWAAGPQPASADLFGRERETADRAAPEPPAEASTVFTAAALADALPRAWQGTFAWDNGVAYLVEAEIVALTIRDDGDVSFVAETRWMPDGLTARMSGRIDPATLSVRMWEAADDQSAAGFESDGRYDGSVASDLWDLRAQWTTDGTGETGHLVLIATDTPGATN